MGCLEYHLCYLKSESVSTIQLEVKRRAADEEEWRKREDEDELTSNAFGSLRISKEKLGNGEGDRDGEEEKREAEITRKVEKEEDAVKGGRTSRDSVSQPTSISSLSLPSLPLSSFFFLLPHALCLNYGQRRRPHDQSW